MDYFFIAKQHWWTIFECMRRRVASTELHIAHSARAEDAEVSWRTFCEAAGMNVLFLLLPSIRRYLKSGADASTRLPADWRLEGLRTASNAAAARKSGNDKN